MVMILVMRIGQECLSVLDIRRRRKTGCRARELFPVGASLLAMNVNDNALIQEVRVGLDVHRERARSYRGLGTILGDSSPMHSFSPPIAGRCS
ncbi:hypothetical protein CRX42_15300 [Pseudomonas jessenii]|uniref:Uncharacterized protein n=1 Tax=Pseudomonas jessenii TaxID=77298 RepID=A0A2W0EUU3_PSEJE|nr:hypothetical protein CRX42_15300 [Pseudomonas jessenii]